MTQRHDAIVGDENNIEEHPMTHSEILNLQTAAITLRQSLTVVGADLEVVRAEKIAVVLDRDTLQREKAVLVEEIEKMTPKVPVETPAEQPQLVAETPAV